MQSTESEKQSIDETDEAHANRLTSVADAQLIKEEDGGTPDLNNDPNHTPEVENILNHGKVETPSSTEDVECSNQSRDSPLSQSAQEAVTTIEYSPRQAVNEQQDQIDEETTGGGACSMESHRAAQDFQQEHEANQRQSPLVQCHIKEKAEAFIKRRCSPKTRDRLQVLNAKRSPSVWGTTTYAKLWEKALELGEAMENPTPPLEHLDINCIGSCPSNSDCQQNSIEGEHRSNRDMNLTSENAISHQAVTIQFDDLDQQEERLDSPLLPSRAALTAVEADSDYETSDSDAESEWELTFDESDPLERYTITTTGGGKV